MAVEQFKLAVKKIVAENGEDFEEDHWHVGIDPDESYLMHLGIERHGDELMVMHTYKQNGDMMRDPEMVFRIQDDGDWVPIVFRQDPIIHQIDEDGLGQDAYEFTETWAINLKDFYVGSNSQSNQGGQA